MHVVWVTGNQQSVWFQLHWFELVPGVMSSKADLTADTHLRISTHQSNVWTLPFWLNLF